jgi:hypothetical protein
MDSSEEHEPPLWDPQILHYKSWAFQTQMFSTRYLELTSSFFDFNKQTNFFLKYKNSAEIIFVSVTDTILSTFISKPAFILPQKR